MSHLPSTVLSALFGLSIATQAQITYVDANSSNTQAVGGTPSPFSTTSTTSDNLWKFRAGFGFDVSGNNGIYEKDGISGGYGDAAKLETTITGLTPDTKYAVYVNFLSATNASWRVQAGIAENTLTLFTPTNFNVENLGLSSVAGSNRDQLRGFIANAASDASGNINIYIDDTDPTSDSNRAWFDGVSYGPVIVPPEPEAGLIASDGVWTWFNDERAIWHKGKLYVGYVKRNGRVALTQYDPITKTSLETELSTVTEVDDHNDPALHVLPDGKILASYSRHSVDRHFFYRTSKITEPSTLTDWGTEFTKGNPDGDKHSYANTYAMSDEGNKIFTFTRGSGWNPNWTTSTDNGSIWSTLKTLIKNGSGSVRPYVRYTGNGKDSIDILYTDGHPRATANSLYHARITGGNVVQSDGSVIKALADTPLIHDASPTPERGTVIYQYSAAAQTDPNQWIPTGRAWSWDIQYQKNNDPVATFTVQVDEAHTGGTGWTADRIYYYYARWTGTSWQKRFIAQGGRPLYQAEDDYAGGIVIDPERPNVVYISSNAADPFNLTTTTNIPLRTDSRYEIWKGTTADGGLTFTWEAVTENSTENNIRPYVPRNHGRSESLLWLKGTYTTYENFNTRVMGKIGQPQTSYSDWKTQEGIAGDPDDDDNENGIANSIEYHAYVSGDVAPSTLITPVDDGVALPSTPASASLISELEVSDDLSAWSTVATSIYGHPFALLTSEYLMETISDQLIITPTSPLSKNFYRLRVLVEE